MIYHLFKTQTTITYKFRSSKHLLVTKNNKTTILNSNSLILTLLNKLMPNTLLQTITITFSLNNKDMKTIKVIILTITIKTKFNKIKLEWGFKVEILTIVRKEQNLNRAKHHFI